MAERTHDNERDGIQCIARRRRDGFQCKNTAVSGSRLCAGHGGVKEVAQPEIAEAIEEVKRFVQPIPADHPMANPINGFYATWRYNEGRIAFLEDKVSKLDDEDLVWGVTKEEYVAASEFPGTNETKEAKKNVWLVLLDEALAQRVKLLTLAAKLGIEKARLESAQGLKAQTVTVIFETLKNLGFDGNSDDVKTAIRNAITTATEINMRGTLAEQIVPTKHGFDRSAIMKRA
ncbi:MAG: hypothetical protein ACM3UO_00350 [Bacillota bacterium]